MTSAKVIPVLWRAPGDLPTSKITDFATVLSSTAYLPWIQNEYGVGPVDLSAAPITITPSQTATTLTSSQIGAELSLQISNKTLPPTDGTPTESYLYMVYFPSDIKLSDSATSTSCVNFCGYHTAAAAPIAGHKIYFAALPDLNVCTPNPDGSDCKGSDFVQDTTAAMSHELVEALTDPDTVTGWRDAYQPAACSEYGASEIGDFCVGNTKSIQTTATPPVEITVQAMFSNASASCQFTSMGAPLNLFGLGGGSSLALTGNLSDNSGIPMVSTGGIAGSTFIEDFEMVATSDPNFLHTYQKQGVPLWGDFDGDGLADLAVTGDFSWTTIPTTLSSQGTFPLWATNAGVTTLNPPIPALGEGANFPALAATTEWTPPPVVGDFNGDGRSDIAKIGATDSNGYLKTIPIAYGTGNAAGPASGLWWSTNQSDGGLNAIWASSAESHAIAADFNRDGRSDLVLVGGIDNASGKPWPYIYIAYSNGDGTFQTVRPEPVFVKGTSTLSTFGSTAASDYYAQALAGDFNGDGFTDIALIGAETPPWTTIPIAFGQADGTFYMSNSSGGDNTAFAQAASATPMKIAAGDYNDDGVWDLVLVGPWTTPQIAFSNGDGTFRRITAIGGTSLTQFMSLGNEAAAILVSAQQDIYRQL